MVNIPFCSLSYITRQDVPLTITMTAKQYLEHYQGIIIISHQWKKGNIFKCSALLDFELDQPPRSITSLDSFKVLSNILFFRVEKDYEV